MRLIKVPDSSFESEEVIIAGTTYNLLFKYNTSDAAWYITIRDTEFTPLVSGIKVMPNQNLTKAFSYLNIFSDGDLWCRRAKATRYPIGRDNFGVGKSYELVWLSDVEMINVEIEDVTQLPPQI